MRAWTIRACLLVALAPVAAGFYQLTQTGAPRFAGRPPADPGREAPPIELPLGPGCLDRERSGSILYSPRHQRLFLPMRDGRSVLVDTVRCGVVRWFDFTLEREGWGSLLHEDRAFLLRPYPLPSGATSSGGLARELVVHSLIGGELLSRRVLDPPKPTLWREGDGFVAVNRLVGPQEAVVGYQFVFGGGGGRPTSSGSYLFFRIDLRSLEVAAVTDESELRARLRDSPGPAPAGPPTATESDGSLVYDNTRVSLRRATFEPVRPVK